MIASRFLCYAFCPYRVVRGLFVGGILFKGWGNFGLFCLDKCSKKFSLDVVWQDRDY